MSNETVRIEELTQGLKDIRDILYPFLGSDILGSGATDEGEEYPIIDEVSHNITQLIKQ